jgi:glucokinase
MRADSSNSSSSLAVGVDLGGTKLAVCVVDSHGAFLYRQKFPVEKQTPSQSFEQISDAISDALNRASQTPGKIMGIGMVVPGIFDVTTGMAWAPNLWGDQQIPLRDALEARLPLPLTIESDRSGYVLGEHWLGAGRGLDDIVFMAVGTGIGLGILTGGRIYSGAHGIAGAIGWFAVDTRKLDIYRQMGCLEAESAGPAVAMKAAAQLRAGRSSLLNDWWAGQLEHISTESVVEAARQGDTLALEVMHEVACYLGMGVANVISLLNPQLVVLGGGLLQAADLILEPLRREAAEWAQPVAMKKTRIEVSRLGEDAGLLGAARLGFLHHLTE